MKSSPPIHPPRRKKAPASRAKITGAVPSPAKPLRVFSVPEPVRALDPFELPLSTRLEAALRTQRVRQLGDLHDVAERDVQAVRNCGAKTTAELVRLIKRAAGGEFALPAAAARKPADLVQLLDAQVAKLPARNRTIFRLRLGAETGEKMTLEEVGQKFGLTRERVRQVEEICLETLRRSGSLPLKFHLAQLAARCRKARQPLSAALLAEWLGSAAAAARRSSPAYYVRLIGHLDPESSKE